MTGFGPESKVGKVIFAMIFIPFSLASKAKDALSKLRTRCEDWLDKDDAG
jgi:hypothetical protein